ncbi:MAG: GDP-mannose 4,6-dehydratase [Methanotrichaceae archaeon]|nr:GDP-mannose 4,6-dehydratase [Methanotrichaceae archaeon]
MHFKEKSVLITGISGFVGSHMAKAVLDGGGDCYGLIRRRSDGMLPRNLARFGLDGQVNLVEGDLEDISSIGHALTASDPDVVFHLGAQSFVPRSFSNPIETMNSNCQGTANLLEAIRIKEVDPVVVFAGSSEEYGLVISSVGQLEKALREHGSIFPPPLAIPELPISEVNPLRPMSPYAVSKVYGDFLMRNYWHSYGIKAVVSRAFNHEGAGRGNMFVTSVVTSQVMKLRFGEAESLTIGNVNAFRDWSHVMDIVDGYLLLAEKGRYGDVYNQGSMRTASVMSYLLLSLKEAGYPVDSIESLKGGKAMESPLDPDDSTIFGISFDKTRLDGAMLRGELEFLPQDKGVAVHSGEERIRIDFDMDRFRPAEVPILLSDIRKIESLGFEVKHALGDVIRDQLNHYLSEKERKGSY